MAKPAAVATPNPWWESTSEGRVDTTTDVETRHMKNKKTILGSGAAIVTAAALITGGTFAAWSDFDVITGNVTEAGHLVLNTNSTGSINNVGGNAIAPGESRTIDFFVASADLDGVPLADLSMKIESLVDIEDGCNGSGEAVAQAAEYSGTDCANTAQPGQFSDQAYVRVRYSNPTDVSNITFGGNSCSAPGGYVNSVGYAPPSSNDTTIYPRLDTLTGSNALTSLTGNQGICIRIDLGLDPDATNSVQGDSSTFDLRFDLEQA